MRVMVCVDVKLLEIPELEERKPNNDPLAMLGDLATKVLQVPGLSLPTYPPPGLHFSKTVGVTAHRFADLTKIVEQFEALLSELELTKV